MWRKSGPFFQAHWENIAYAGFITGKKLFLVKISHSQVGKMLHLKTVSLSELHNVQEMFQGPKMKHSKDAEEQGMNYQLLWHLALK